MDDRLTSDAGSAMPVTKDFFLGRQPILDRSQDLLAYELLFRRAPCGSANVTDDLSATATVIAHAAELGLDIVIGNALGFVNVDATALMSDFVTFLPSDKIVLEILESVEVTPPLLTYFLGMGCPKTGGCPLNVLGLQSIVDVFQTSLQLPFLCLHVAQFGVQLG